MRSTIQLAITTTASSGARFRIDYAKMRLIDQLNANVKSVIDREKHATLVKHLIDANVALLQHSLRNYSANSNWLQKAISTFSSILHGAGVELYCTVTRVRGSNGVRDVVLLSVSSQQHKRLVSISSDPHQCVKVYALPGSGQGFRPTTEDPAEVLTSIAKLMVDFFNRPGLQSGDLRWQQPQYSRTGTSAQFFNSSTPFLQSAVTL